MLPHVAEKTATDRQAGGAGQHGVDAAARAERGLSAVAPLLDFASGEDGQTVEAGAPAAAIKPFTVALAEAERGLDGVCARCLSEGDKQVVSHDKDTPVIFSVVRVLATKKAAAAAVTEMSRGTVGMAYLELRVRPGQRASTARVGRHSVVGFSILISLIFILLEKGSRFWI